MKRFTTHRKNLFGATAVALSAVVLLAASPVAAQEGGSHSQRPLEDLDIYVCGFHLAKANPDFQIEVEHYCAAHSEDLHQCVLYHGTGEDAKLLGTEYIISDALYQDLPTEEKKYWHPHTYEVLSGQLVAPGMSQQDEMALMEKLMTTWGKTFHTWPDPSTRVPMGDPILMWSFTGDGQADEQMVEQRNERLRIDGEQRAENRQERFNRPVPLVRQPNDIDDIGRQWTNFGPDTPEERRDHLGHDPERDAGDPAEERGDGDRAETGDRDEVDWDDPASVIGEFLERSEALD